MPASTKARRRLLSGLLAGCALSLLLFGAGSAHGASTWWGLTSASWPAQLQPGATGKIVVTAENLGYAGANGGVDPVILEDTLPQGLEVLSNAGVPEIEAVAGDKELVKRGAVVCTVPAKHEVLCEFDGTLPPFEEIELDIAVGVSAGASSAEANQLTVSGAGVAGRSLTRPLSVGSGASGFGVEDFALDLEEEGGEATTQAGKHPFQLTSVLAMNVGEVSSELVKQQPAGLAKDVKIQLPPGLIGNPTPFPRCSAAQFAREEPQTEHDECAPKTAVGVATIAIDVPGGGQYTTRTVPVFNLEPLVGEPARFGFEVKGFSATIDTSVRTGGDYGVTVSISNITQISGFISAKVTFWGVPGSPLHDGSRGWNCIEDERFGPCAPLQESQPPPLLSLPTACTAAMRATVQADSWGEPHPPASSALSEPLFREFDMGPLDGCNGLQFEPSIKVVPDLSEGSRASGLLTDVHVPQTAVLNAEGLSESAVKDITVALPEGIALNPAGASGLEACTEGLAGFERLEPGTQAPRFTATLPEPLEPGKSFCPDASKVATVKITTPLLPNPLTGAVYVATQNQNPFGSLIAMYLIAKDPVSGTVVKLPGEVALSQASGQLTATFANSPDLPFEDAELHFFGEERAPLATPARCGSYTTHATLTPWDGNGPVGASSSFQITSGPHGSPCPGATLPFSPALTGGTTNIDAGAFSSLTTTLGRDDGQQGLRSVQLHMPPGLSGVLSGVALCPESQANEGTCPQASQIGETTVSAGVGSDPVTVVGGKVYLTEKYHGAPFGLSIVDPVKTGPFDLEHDTANPGQDPACDCVVVRAKVEVDPLTAALTVTTNSESEGHAIPSMIDGIPVQLKNVNVTIDRPGFTFNPTDCNPTQITASIGGAEGASSLVSVPFQVTNCALLKFAPQFAASVPGKSSKADGEALTVKLTYPTAPQGTQANIRYVKVELPKQLPSELRTLQQACLAKVFEENPAGCPEHSIVGHARALTPILPVPLTGPAYFVSYGAAKFPELVMVLQGYGVTIDLHGETFINNKTGITSSTFAAVPDQPVTSFELTLPAQPYSALGANLPAKDNYSFCAQKMVMPTHFIAHNGAELKQVTPIAVIGCGKARSATPAQKLAAALKACRKDKNRAKREKCEKTARTRYGKAAKTSKKKKKKKK